MEETKRITISGVAVREGLSRNNRKYLAEELNKFAPTLIGRPILKDHEGLTDNVIGKITEAQSIDGGKSIIYKGWVKEDGTGLLEKFRDGRISEVSIGSFSRRFVRDKDNEEVIIPIDMEALELSTTPTPGVIGTSISVGENIKEESIKSMIENYEKENTQSNSHIIEKEDKMESDDIKSAEVAEGEAKVEETPVEAPVEEPKAEEPKEETPVEETEVEKLKAELEALKAKNVSFEQEKIALEESKRQDAINKYKEKATAKKLKLRDFSNASMEMILLATEMVDEFEIDDDNTEEEEDSDEPVIEVEEKAKVQSKEVISEVKSKETFEGYKITQEDTIGGVAFFKYY